MNLPLSYTLYSKYKYIIHILTPQKPINRLHFILRIRRHSLFSCLYLMITALVQYI